MGVTKDKQSMKFANNTKPVYKSILTSINPQDLPLYSNELASINMVKKTLIANADCTNASINQITNTRLLYKAPQQKYYTAEKRFGKNKNLSRHRS